MATMEGGCHCGRVRFRVTADLDSVTICNCSICAKKGIWHLIVPPEGAPLGSPPPTLNPLGGHVAFAIDDYDAAVAALHAAGIETLDFRKGYIERLPVDDGTFDCVISNGVINLSPDKPAVFAAAARALRSGGRLALSDIVTAEQLPEGITCDASLWAACIGGAMQRDGYRVAIEAAGFEVEQWRENPEYRFVSDRADNATQKYGVTSISLLARRR